MHIFVSGCSEGVNSTFANHFQTNIGMCKNSFSPVWYIPMNYTYITFTKPYKNSFNWCMKLTIIYSFGGYKLSKQTIPPTPSTHTKKRKKTGKNLLFTQVVTCVLWFSVECYGFKFLKFHSVTDDDILNDSKNKKQHCQCYYPFATLSDRDRISPYNINTIPSRQAMRLKKNINQGIIM